MFNVILPVVYRFLHTCSVYYFKRVIQLKKLTLFSTILIILLSGCFMNHDFDESTTKKAEEVAESFMRNNYQDIETIEIEDVYRNPMSGMSVEGIVNGQYHIVLGMDESDLTVQSIGESEGLPDKKEGCEEVICDY